MPFHNLTRLILLAFALLGVINGVEATHLAGAEIQYRYIGDSTGTARHYEVILKIYRDANGVQLLPTTSVGVFSSCFGQLVIPMTRELPSDQTDFGDGGYATPGFNDCVSSAMASRIIVTHYYRGTVALPSNCADIHFYWHQQARNPSNNLLNAASSSLYVQAFLNNVNGQNSSPQFVTPAAKAFCSNKFFVWSQATIESDGDSVFYDFAPALTGVGFPSSTMNYAPGYSHQQPITTAAGSGGIQIDQATGTFTFTTSPIQEVCVIVVQVREYRFNSILQAWELVGTSLRDMQIVIAAVCLPSVVNGPQIVTDLPGYGLDTLSGSLVNLFAGQRISNDSIPSISSPTGYDYLVPTVEYTCGDSLIELQFDVKLQCQSVALDGSDFRMLGPDTVPKPIIGVDMECGFTQLTDKIRLVLHQPLTVNGDYELYVKLGNDGNTLTNECGFELQEFYTMVIQVRNCFDPIYDITNVTVDTNQTVRLTYQFDTSTFPIQFFEGFSVLRSSDNGQTYQHIADELGPNIPFNGEWVDPYLGQAEVNQRSYGYQLKGVFNSVDYQPTRGVTSIHLDTVANGASRDVKLVWNSFNGWFGVNYSVSITTTPEDPFSWIPISSQGNNPTSDTSLVFRLPKDSGCYFVKVKAINYSFPDWISHSNWVKFCVPMDDGNDDVTEAPNSYNVLVPNIFTPNGDNLNDEFIIGNADLWEESELQVYNRWGERVYFSSNAADENWNGRVNNSGNVVSDGVYFYLLKLTNNAEGDQQLLQGTVTVQSGRD